MKKLLLFIPIIFLSLSNYAQTTFTWNGLGTTNNFSEGANWVGGTAPAFATVVNVVFNGTSSKNCTFDLGLEFLADFTMTSAYAGTVNCAGDVVIVSGNFSVNGGTFISTSGTMSFINGTGTRNITLGGSAVFINNSGILRITPIANETITFSGAFALNVLQISNTAIGAQSNINLGSGIAVAGNFAFTGNQSVAFQGNINLNGGIQAINTSTVVPTSNTAIWTISGTAAQTFSGTIGAAQGYLPNIVINKTTGVLTLLNGTAYNLNNSSWTHTAGSYLANTTSTLNAYGTCSIVTTGATVDHLVINSGATLTAPAGNLNLRGNFINNGTFIHNKSTITFARTLTTTVQSSIGGSTSPTTFYRISTASPNVANTKTITLNTNVDIVMSIDINNNTILNTNSKTLQLLSDITQRAYVAGAGTNAQIIGNIKVNTFAKSGKTGWTNLGVAGVTGNTFANWEDDMIMTCVGCPLGTNLGGTTFVSITGYNEAAETYPDKVYTDALTPGTGYWVYLGTSSVTTANQTITVTGPAVQGNINVSLTSAAATPSAKGFNLIGNPYPSPISWNAAFATNSLVVNNAIYVWNPDLAAGAGAFATYAGGVATPNTAQGTRTIIPMGQGFYVEAIAAGTFSFTEAHKSGSNSASFTLLKTTALGDTVLEPGDSIQGPVAQNVFRLKVTGPNNWEDETVFHFNSNATPNHDQLYDAHKYPTAGLPYMSSVLNGEEFSINALPFQSPSVSIPVKLITDQTKTYTISPIDISEIPGSGCVILHDNYLNVNHDLRTGAYVCTIADTTTQARFSLEVCTSAITTNINSLANGNNMSVFQNQQGTFVKTLFASETEATISAYNTMGQQIMTDLTVNGKETTTRLELNVHNQIVIIKITTDKEKISKKVFVN